MQRTLLAAALLLLASPLLAAQEQTGKSPGLEALEAARKARKEKESELGLDEDGRLVLKGQRSGEEIQKILKKLQTEMPKIQKAWLDDLKKLNEQHLSDPAINQIRWEYAKALRQQGQGREARKILELLGPSGLDLEDRQDAIQLLINLGMLEKASTLLTGLELDKFTVDQERFRVLAVLAAVGQKTRAIQGLAGEFEGVEDGEEMWEIIDELERRVTVLPPSLHRPLLAALYEECLRKFPGDEEPGRRDALGGLALQTGSAALPISGSDLDDKQRDLDQFKGNVLFIHFWASWHKQTMDELDELKKLEKKHGPKGFRILGVSLDSPADTARKAATDTRLTWPILCDGKAWRGDIVSRYAIKRIPFSILLDQQGKVAGIGLGVKELEGRLADLLD